MRACRGADASPAVLAAAPVWMACVLPASQPMQPSQSLGSPAPAHQHISPASACLGQSPCRRYVARRGAAGPPPTSPLAVAAERAGTLLLSPLVTGMAGVLSLAGLLSDPEAEERERERRAAEEDQQLAEVEASAAAAATAAAADASLAAAAAAAAPKAAQQAVRAVEQAATEQEQHVPAGRSPAEALQAAAAADMAEVDMRAQRSAALRARKPPTPVTPEELKPRHTARPELTAAANALHAPPPPPKAMPPPVPEAAEGEEFDANVALSMQVSVRMGMWQRRLTAVSLCGAAACSHATHLIRCKLYQVQCAGLVASALLFLPCSSFPCSLWSS